MQPLNREGYTTLGKTGVPPYMTHSRADALIISGILKKREGRHVSKGTQTEMFKSVWGKCITPLKPSVARKNAKGTLFYYVTYVTFFTILLKIKVFIFYNYEIIIVFIESIENKVSPYTPTLRNGRERKVGEKQS